MKGSRSIGHGQGCECQFQVLRHCCGHWKARVDSRQGKDRIRLGFRRSSQESRVDSALRAWAEEKGQVYQGREGKMRVDTMADDAKSHMRRPEKWPLDLSARVSSYCRECSVRTAGVWTPEGGN